MSASYAPAEALREAMGLAGTNVFLSPRESLGGGTRGEMQARGAGAH